jgi:phosphoribosylglycinamide formyltransferase-1
LRNAGIPPIGWDASKPVQEKSVLPEPFFSSEFSSFLEKPSFPSENFSPENISLENISLEKPVDSSEKKVNILVLVSGNGTNLHALLSAGQRDALGGGRVTAVAADRPCYGLERARSAGIPGYLASDSDGILRTALKEQAECIVLAGFLPILSGKLLEAYAGRMINLHPSLLPKFGGKGMYGIKVHRAVLSAGEAESGCTVHFVTAGVDRGPILLQRRVPVLPGDDPETLADRVRREEHIAVTEGSALLCRLCRSGSARPV